jgi:hypothetical protein
LHVVVLPTTVHQWTVFGHEAATIASKSEVVAWDRMSAPELRVALVTAFPPTPIARETIYTADAGWNDYTPRDDLSLLEGKSWVDLTPEILERHATLLTHAGGALYRAILPAFLLQLVEQAECHSVLRYTVVGQLTHMEYSDFARAVFLERISPMTVEQRDVVRSALAIVAEQEQEQLPELAFFAAAALRSW